MACRIGITRHPVFCDNDNLSISIYNRRRNRHFASRRRTLSGVNHNIHMASWAHLYVVA